MRVGMVAGEPSGDYLGAGLIQSLKRQVPDLQVEGIGGPLMKAQGFTSHYPMDKISIMGLDGLFGSVFDILRVRKDLFRRFISNPPDVFVGVDVPDFNLGLEERLRSRGIPTVHYVSPTVWAWRGYRIRKIRRAVDLMLTLFPFEADYYRQQDVPVTFVGHPAADELPESVDRQSLRSELGVGATTVIAMLPGSRLSELKRLGGIFLEVARRLHRRYPSAAILVPFANDQTRDYFSGLTDFSSEIPTLSMSVGQSRKVLAASDVALVASGTAALESALFGTPLVVTYKVSGFTLALVRLTARVKYFSMPNNLLPEAIVPEYLQQDAKPELIETGMRRYIDDENFRRQTRDKLMEIPLALKRGANATAAEAVISLVGGRVGLGTG